MRWLVRIQMWVRMLFGRLKAEARLNEELRDHLERQIDENIATGMNTEEARYAALRTFGNLELVREQACGTWSWTWLELLVRDLRYGVRSVGRSPGFASVAILVMALGVGINTSIFSLSRFPSQTVCSPSGHVPTLRAKAASPPPGRTSWTITTRTARSQPSRR
jgi:putative ABC transport system permease protein